MSGHAGQRKREALPPDAMRQRCWNSMRQLRSFTNADLEATAEAGAALVKKYTHALVGAEYLIVEKPRESGKTGGHARFRLVKNTGPVAPRIDSDGKVFDANIADPYALSPSKRLARHAVPFHKALREIVDAFRPINAQLSVPQIAALSSCAAALLRYEEDRR